MNRKYLCSTILFWIIWLIGYGVTAIVNSENVNAIALEYQHHNTDKIPYWNMFPIYAVILVFAASCLLIYSVIFALPRIFVENKTP